MANVLVKDGAGVTKYLKAAGAGTDGDPFILDKSVTLNAGTALVGKVGIDQTTPGTTDSVSVATGQGAGATIGETSGEAVVTDDDGTLQQYLRGLVKWAYTYMPATLDQKTMAASFPVVIASNQSAVAVTGTITAVTAITNALPAGTNLIGKVQPMSAILEGGLTELVGVDEQVDQNDYSGSVGVALGGTYSGEILSIALYATKDGTGAVQDSAGTLYVFDADPTIASGDTSMTAAERVTAIGKVNVVASDWDTDANGGLAFLNVSIPFHAVATLHFVWKHTDATALNDASGDDEQLEFNFWWRRES